MHGMICRGPAYCRGVIVTQVVPHYDARATLVVRYREALARHAPEESPNFGSLEALTGASEVELQRVGGIGPRIASEIRAALTNVDPPVTSSLPRE